MEYISKFKASKIDSLLTYVENTVKSQLADIETIRSGASKGATAIQDVKTINGQSIVGKGNIVVQGGGGSVEGYPNVDELEEVKELSGNENIIITDSEGNKKTTIGNLKEYVVKDISELPPFRIFETESDYNAVKDELGDCVVCLRDTGVMLYHVYRKAEDGEEGGGEIEDKYIRFADPEVQRILVENFSADGVGMTSEDIEKVTDVGIVFNGNTVIETFDEFEKFLGVTAIGTEEWSDWKAAFKGCSELTSIILPPSLRQIGYDVFRDCVKLTSANIYNVTRIWHQAFFNCTELHIDVLIPNASIVGSSAFANSGINRVLDIGSITKLAGGWGADEGVFRKCKSLTVAILPETLTDIGIQVFAGCEALEALIAKNPTPSTCGAAVLDGSDNCKIYVPDASVEAYKTATNWSSFASRIKGISELPIDNAELYEEIKDYLN